MKKRTIIYFRRKRIMKKLGCTSWHLDWTMFNMPSDLPSMAMILPGGPLTHHTGELVAPDPKFMAPPLLSYIDEIPLIGFIHQHHPLPTINIHYHEMPQIPMELNKSTQDFIDLQEHIMDKMMSDILLKKETIIHIKSKPDNDEQTF